VEECEPACRCGSRWSKISPAKMPHTHEFHRISGSGPHRSRTVSNECSRSARGTGSPILERDNMGRSVVDDTDPQNRVPGDGWSTLHSARPLNSLCSVSAIYRAAERQDPPEHPRWSRGVPEEQQLCVSYRRAVIAGSHGCGHPASLAQKPVSNAMSPTFTTAGTTTIWLSTVPFDAKRWCDTHFNTELLRRDQRV
jgi:hypothetical protein